MRQVLYVVSENYTYVHDIATGMFLSTFVVSQIIEHNQNLTFAAASSKNATLSLHLLSPSSPSISKPSSAFKETKVGILPNPVSSILDGGQAFGRPFKLSPTKVFFCLGVGSRNEAKFAHMSTIFLEVWRSEGSEEEGSSAKAKRELEPLWQVWRECGGDLDFVSSANSNIAGHGSKMGHGDSSSSSNVKLKAAAATTTAGKKRNSSNY